MRNPIPPRHRRWWSRFVGSRKWLLVVFVVPAMMYAGRWGRVAAVVTAYLAVEGGSDLITRWKYGNADALTRDPGRDTDADAPAGDAPAE